MEYASHAIHGAATAINAAAVIATVQRKTWTTMAYQTQRENADAKVVELKIICQRKNIHAIGLLVKRMLIVRAGSVARLIVR